jgi:di/tricarboxylate transporter
MQDETQEFRLEYPSCPCPPTARILQDDSNNDSATWEIVYTCVVLFIMFAALISDRLGADSIMLAAVTAFMAAEIITIREGLAGFSNEGLLTVLVLFVVAEGISKTGALDWYMGRLLGNPPTIASAQLRLMAPIAVVSAFLNNTPVVVVMIPIVQRWAKQIRVSPQQLLIPLSFASILGGTCTLIGTSTNLVVLGLLEERYPDDPDVAIALFSLGTYGVPVALTGIAYILLASPVLLPGGQGQGGSSPLENNEDVLLGARLTQWSPAASRTVKRSGLRDTGGIYLVSVHRAATGNVHRAVSNDFVLNVGDILYFTGFVESFGEFCEEHGLEVVTNEVETCLPETQTHETRDTVTDQVLWESLDQQRSETSIERNHGFSMLTKSLGSLDTVAEDPDAIPVEVGMTKESLLRADEDQRLRSINRMTDLIRDDAPSKDNSILDPKRDRLVSERLRGGDPAKIVVTIDKDLVVVGINVKDRSGLMLDISKGLLRLNLQLHHTEAAVVGDRSISIWRCEVIGTELPDLEEIWSVMNALLSIEGGIATIKQRGLRVIRARVVQGSRLIGRKGADIDFRKRYQAAIVALQNNGKNSTQPLSQVSFDVGDVLVLQVGEASPLLQVPPSNFYKGRTDNSRTDENVSRNSSVRSLVNMVTWRKASTDNLEAMDKSRAGRVSERMEGATPTQDDDYFIESEGSEVAIERNGDEEDPAVVDMPGAMQQIEEQEAVWKDLQLLVPDERIQSGDGAAREFLTAMQVAPKSKLSGKTVARSGIDKLPDLFLVSIERPISAGTSLPTKTKRLSVISGTSDAHSLGEDSNQRLGSIPTDNQAYQSIAPEEPLQHGDVLWFSGSASSVGDLRKIPGLISYQNDEVEKINEKVHDRRLVQAVIARKGPLVGKTVKEVQFRKRYGAAVIAVHREGKRVHEHPGNVKLQAGDVLLLEAGPSFIAKSGENDRSFALLAEVEDSAPPRLSLLIPALLITAGMLIVFMADWTSLLVSALVASMLMVALGILSEQEARDAVNWDVFITIAAAFGIGTALVNSGVAGGIANFLVDVGTALGIGSAGLLGAVYFATFLISNVVTNNAAAALLFPIALDAAEQTGTDRVLMSYALMLGASASFMSPYGYTTNLLIYGPGGYKYKDFLVFGTPMQIVLWVASIAFLAIIEPWYISWIASSVFLGLAIALRSLKASFTGLCCSSRIEDGTETGKKSVIG